MIVARLQGGLGNQLFQYSAGRALASSLGTRLVLDTTLLDARRIGVTPRSYELGRYRIAAEIAGPELSAEIARRCGRVRRRLHAIGVLRSRFALWRDPSLAFDPAFFEQRDDTILEGYWQSEKYFAAVRESLLRELGAEPSTAGAVSALAAEMDTADSVSLHVRRGDYVSNRLASAKHGAMPVDYYRAALAHVAERVAAPHAFVFTDDPEWVRTSLPLSCRSTLVSGAGLDAGEELYLMSRCRHHVIANSSFSWWGAWLDPRPDKTVVAPRNWFRNEPAPRDLLPASWSVA